MLSKRNLGIALMAVIAGFLIYQGGKYVHALALSGPTLANISGTTSDTQNCASCDPDHDGLTNSEEVLWNSDPFNADTDSDGFKDGEEVASGHNPLVPGPDDLINTDNLTDQLADLTVSGIEAGDINPASAGYSGTLANITSSVADSAKYLFNKKTDSLSFTSIPSNYETDTAYTQVVSPIIKNFSDTLNDQLSRIVNDLNNIGKSGFNSNLKSYYGQQAAALGDSNNKLTSMSIPKVFLDSHSLLISNVSQLESIDEAIANGDKDVVKATLALEAMGDMPDKYISFLNAYISIVQSEKLDLNSLNNYLK